MRIQFLGEPLGSPSGLTDLVDLDKLFAQHSVLRGKILRLTSSTLVLQVQQLEVEFDLQNVADNMRLTLQEGLIVELQRLDETTLSLKLPTTQGEGITNEVGNSPLSQVLVDLGVPPTQASLEVSQGLLQRGFGLKKELIWLLLPWAEQGKLDEAFLLLQARFPLKPSLVELVARGKGRTKGEPIYAQAKSNLPEELQELFQKPSWESRRAWTDKFVEGGIFKALVRLVVEERFLDALSSDFVFALPFLQGEDLQASWVRISREDEGQQSENEMQPSFKVELEIPTLNFGLICVKLIVRGKNLALHFRAETLGQLSLESALNSLQEELTTCGWTLVKVNLRGWEDA